MPNAPHEHGHLAQRGRTDHPSGTRDRLAPPAAARQQLRLDWQHSSTYVLLRRETYTKSNLYAQRLAGRGLGSIRTKKPVAGPPTGLKGLFELSANERRVHLFTRLGGAAVETTAPPEALRIPRQGCLVADQLRRRGRLVRTPFDLRGHLVQPHLQLRVAAGRLRMRIRRDV